ncbi:MAG: SIR2 family NAD-dependent protein deacylase [Chloroflexota bacterium]
MAEEEQTNALIEKAADLIVNGKKIVVFTGAGVSTESGIPDFRSPGGIWTRYDPDIFTYERFVNDPEARKTHWQLLAGREFITPDVQPNASHYAAAELEKMGKLSCVITQNVDNLHERARNSPEKVLHLHGNLENAKCLGCGYSVSMDEVRTWFESGTEVPDCPQCGGLLKPDAVFFGEALPMQELNEAQHRSQNCDVCVVIGSSLVVYPAALMPHYAEQAGARMIIVNRDPTDLDSSSDVCIHASAGETMSQIMELVRAQLKES